MTPIQLLLFLFLLLIAVFYFRRLRSRVLDRFVFFLIVIAAMLLIARPDWATALANFLGVGRGTDLITYLGLSGLAFLWLSLYTRQRELDMRLTDLARQLALLKSEQPDQPDD